MLVAETAIRHLQFVGRGSGASATELNNLQQLKFWQAI
jgi:hypothetical protein